MAEVSLLKMPSDEGHQISQIDGVNIGSYNSTIIGSVLCRHRTSLAHSE